MTARRRSDHRGGGPGGSTTGGNQAQLTVLLVPTHDRARSSSAIGNELRTVLSNAAPSAKIQVGLPNAFGFGGFGG